MNEGKFRWILIILIIAVLLVPVFITYFTMKDEHKFENNDTNEVITDHDQTGTTFVVNMKSKKYHLLHCDYANVKDETDLTTFSDEEFLIKHGYEPCKKCIFWR